MPTTNVSDVIHLSKSQNFRSDFGSFVTEVVDNLKLELSASITSYWHLNEDENGYSLVHQSGQNQTNPAKEVTGQFVSKSERGSFQG